MARGRAWRMIPARATTTCFQTGWRRRSNDHFRSAFHIVYPTLNTWALNWSIDRYRTRRLCAATSSSSSWCWRAGCPRLDRKNRFDAISGANVRRWNLPGIAGLWWYIALYLLVEQRACSLPLAWSGRVDFPTSAAPLLRRNLFASILRRRGGAPPAGRPRRSINRFRG